jgi:hypothetical protein
LIERYGDISYALAGLASHGLAGLGAIQEAVDDIVEKLARNYAEMAGLLGGWG